MALKATPTAMESFVPVMRRLLQKTLAEASVKGEKVTAENYPNADFNGDGKVTAADAAVIAKIPGRAEYKKSKCIKFVY